MRVSIIRGAPREFLTSLEIDSRWFDFSRNVPKNERIEMLAYVPTPIRWIETGAVDTSAEVGRVVLRWHRFGLGPNDPRMWGLEIVEEPVRWGVLLNVAYTCRTHIDLDLALKVREQLERVLCPDDGHSRFVAS